MFKADRREHQACAGGEGEPAAAHGFKRQIGLAEAGFGPIAPLERADDDRPERPAKLGLPHEICVSELWAHPELAIASRTQFAEAAVDPALLAIDRHEADIAAQL